MVDDDRQFVELVSACLTMYWRDTEVLEARDGKTALEVIERHHPDLVLLDVVMPKMDGYEVLKRLREFSDVPVIMLSARDGLVDRVKGLELGADDYITKPFEHLELLARAKALLRRQEMLQPTSQTWSFTCGDLSVDFSSRQVRRRGAIVPLTATEYRLLYLLVRNAGRALPHEMLLSKIWGEKHVDEVNCLRSYVWRLRSKLEDNPKQPKYILSERGFGYRFRYAP